MSLMKHFNCTFPGCQSTFNRQWKLERHLCTHTGDRPYSCTRDGCSKSYQCKHHLVRHIKTAHDKPQVLLPCSLPSCRASFPSISALAKHMKNHGKPRSFQCSMCGVSFLRESRYQQHLLAHSGKLPFICTICNSGFASQTLLRRHTRRHARRQCSYASCSYSCDSKSVMRKHEKIAHSSVYYCAECNKSFNNKGSLREHVMVHLPEDRRAVFVCPHKPCERSYFQLRNLRHHIKVFHNFTRYYCQAESCKSSYISEIQLQKHISRCHSKDVNKVRETLIESLISIVPAIEDSDTERREDTKSQFELLVTSKDHF